MNPLAGAGALSQKSLEEQAVAKLRNDTKVIIDSVTAAQRDRLQSEFDIAEQSKAAMNSMLLLSSGSGLDEQDQAGTLLSRLGKRPVSSAARSYLKQQAQRTTGQLRPAVTASTLIQPTPITASGAYNSYVTDSSE